MFYRSPTVRTTAVLLLLPFVSISAVLTLYAGHSEWPGIATILAGLVSNALEKKDGAEAKLSKLRDNLEAAKTRKETLEDTRDNLILEFEPIKAKMNRLKKKLSEIDGKVADKTAEVERRQKEYDNCSESEKDAKSAALNTARGELASLLTQQSNQRETNSKYAEETYGPKLARVTFAKANVARQITLISEINDSIDTQLPIIEALSAALQKAIDNANEHQNNPPDHDSHDDDDD